MQHPADMCVPEAVRLLLEEGVQASRANESVRAIELWKQASEALPNWGLPHFLSGSEYASLGQWAKAENALANAVLVAPQLHVARYQLGLMQFSSGRAAMALLTWQPLLDCQDEPALAEYVRGFSALAQDAFAQARVHFEHGLGLLQSNPAIADDVRKVLLRLPVTGEANASGRSIESITSLVSRYGSGGLH